jgi:predicted NUDIX family NTP pyrophosphohydrolase
MAAGVLPIARTDSGQIIVLLGRECIGRTTSQSGLWCDFGGGISPNDCSIYGAAREFIEETLGTVLGHVSISKTVGYILQHRLGTIQSMFGHAKPYDLHVVRVQQDHHIIDLFETRYDACVSACNSTEESCHPQSTRLLSPVFLPARAFNKYGQVKQSFKEKDKIGWFALEQIESCVFETDTIGLRPEFAQTLRHHWSSLQSMLKCIDFQSVT